MKKIYCSLICFIVSLFILSASELPEGNGSIKGKITTAEGSAAADVTIQVKGSSKGAGDMYTSGHVAHRCRFS